MFDVWIELVCDRCSTTRFGQHVYGPIPRNKLRRNAGLSGWTLVTNPGRTNKDWLCKECTELDAKKKSLSGN